MYKSNSLRVFKRYVCFGKVYVHTRKSGPPPHHSCISARESYVCAVSAGALTRNEGAAAEVPLRPFPPWYFAESPLLRHGYGFNPAAVSPDHPRGSGSLRPPPPNNNWRAEGWILSMFAGRIPLIETSPRGVGGRRDWVDPHVPSVALSIRPYHVFCYYISIAYWKTKKGLKNTIWVLENKFIC